MKKIIPYTLSVLLCLITVPAVAADNQYIIIVDAGSSGSRIHVYQDTSISNLPTIKEVFTKSVKPGLSSYANQPESAGASLKPLFDDATQYLTTAGVNTQSVPVNVLATAGMRLLPTEQQQAIYNNVTLFLQANYRFPISAVKTISGKMEGVYGWLDINYLLGNFQHNHAINNQNRINTVGNIDMGGASTEITFETHYVNHPADEAIIKINGRQYTVFSVSFLGLGQDQTLNAMLNNASANACFPADYQFKSDASGQFDMPTCGSIYSSIINDQHVAQRLIPNDGQAFIATAGIYYSYQFLGIDKTPSQPFAKERILDVCDQSWAQLKSAYPDTSDYYLSTYCADGVYAYQLLYNTYKMSNTQLSVVNQINGEEIDWALGAALYHLTNQEY